MSITTTITHDELEGTEMTEAQAGTVRLRLPQSGQERYAWLLARTERLLPEVAALVGRRVALPETLEIELTTGRRMARELAANQAGARDGGVRGRIRTTIARRSWRGLEAAVWDWPSRTTPGARQVVVYLDVASDAAAPTRELEWGALLARYVMLAAMTAQPVRARHLSSNVDELVDTRQAPGARADLRYARLELEHAAGQSAADAWIRHRTRLPVVLARAADALERLDAETADQPGILIRDYYTHRCPPPLEVHELVHLVVRDITGSERLLPGIPVEAERHQRLCAAARADLYALAAASARAAETAELASAAGQLAWALLGYDAEHGTGRGLRGPRDLHWEGQGAARAYTRQEWAAAGGGTAQDEDDEG